ncbi:MAG: DUF2213 domain-containing protein [Nevskiaceae bacterium]|nr:MAG: DUF2213 domain-containing protein [Nevskiaceae bacterium]
MFIIDFERSQRVTTDEGYLKVPGRLARTGIQTYYAFELDMQDRDPMQRIRVYRPESEVFDPESMKSFDGAPITINHPPEGVNIDNRKDLQVGFVNNIRRDGIYLMGDITITDRAAIKALDNGKNELSNGYAVKYVFGLGVSADGEEFDATQTKIRGNHVAMVDAARCGPACRISDAKPTGVNKMAKKVIIDSIPVELEDNAAEIVVALVGARDKAIAEVAKLASQGDITFNIDGVSMTGKQVADALVEARKQIEELKKDVMTPAARDAMVAEWAGMLETVKLLSPKLSTDGKTCAAIRREVVGQAIDGEHKTVLGILLAGNTIDKATDDQVRTAFNVLAVHAKPIESTTTTSGDEDPVAKALQKQGTKDGNTNDGKDKPSGRDAFVSNLQDAWKN